MKMNRFRANSSSGAALTAAIIMAVMMTASCGFMAIGKAGLTKGKDTQPNPFWSLFLGSSDAPSYPPTGTGNQSADTYTRPSTLHAYQLSGEIITRLGDFFTPDHSAVPQPLEFTDASIVLLSPDLRPAGTQTVHTVNVILDAKQGIVYYTWGKNSMGFARHTDFLGGKRLVIGASGRLALIQSDDTVNTCWKFDTDHLARTAGCSAAASNTAIGVSAFGDQAFLYVTAAGRLVKLAADGSTQAVASPLAIDNLRNVWADQTMIVITDKGGERVTVIDPNTAAVVAQTARIDIHLSGTTPLEIGLSGVCPLSGGGYVGVSSVQDVLIFFDSSLRVRAIQQFLSVPYPMEYMHHVRGLSVNLEGGTFAVWSKQAFTMYAARETANYDFGFVLPPAVESQIDVSKVVSVYDALSQNPQADVLDIPEIKSMLDQARSSR